MNKMFGWRGPSTHRSVTGGSGVLSLRPRIHVLRITMTLIMGDAELQSTVFRVLDRNQSYQYVQSISIIIIIKQNTRN